MNYFIIRVPLSYLNAVEAQYYYKIKPEESTLVVLCQDQYPVDLKVIKTILDTSLWHEVHYVSYNLSAFLFNQYRDKKRDSIPGYFNKISVIREFVKELNSIPQNNQTGSRVFIGNENIATMRHIANSINPNEIILIDEGFAVLNTIAEKIKSMNGKFKGLLLRDCMKEFLAKKMFGYKIQSLKNVVYFSSYQIDSENTIKIVRNTYEKLRLDLSKQKTVKQVLFLGQPMIEHSYMTKDAYFDCMRQIKHYYSSSDFVYCPHRDEHPSNLEQLSSDLGLKIKYSQLPIEYRLTKEKNLPEIIAAFYSSALQNIYHMFNGMIMIESFKIHSSDFVCENKKTLDEIENCYNYLKMLKSKTFLVTKLPLT